MSESTPVQRGGPREAISLPRAALGCVLIGAPVLAVLWPVLHTTALIFDDPLYLLNNPLVRDPSLANAWTILTQVRNPATVEGYYHPLGLISLMLDYAMGARPENLFIFRATSLALHIVTTILVSLVIHQLFRNTPATLLSGLVFGLHPCNIESIAWLSDRKTLLAGAFSVAALAFHLHFLRTKRTRFHALGIMAFLLALLAKPMSVPLPVVLVLLDAWPLNRLNAKAIIEKWPYFVLSAVFAVITMISQPPPPPGIPAPPSEYGLALLVMLHNAGFYTVKTIWPYPVNALYPFPRPLQFSNPEMAVYVVVAVLMAAVCALLTRRTRSITVAWIGFLAMLLPAIMVPMQPYLGSVSHTEAIAADRFTYIAKVSLLIAFAGGLHHLARLGEPKTRHWIVLALIALFTLGEAVVTRSYLTAWRDTPTMARHLARTVPTSAHVHVALGNVLSGEGRFDEALPAYQTAIQLEPSYQGHEGLAAILTRKGNIDEAEKHLRAALAINPRSAKAHQNLGRILQFRGQIAEAITEIERAVECSPRSSAAWVDLAIAHFKNREIDKARQHFQRALEIDPRDFRARDQYGCLLIVQGRTAQALDEWRRAATIDPQSVKTLNNLAWILATSEDASIRMGKEAVSRAEDAVRQTAHQDFSTLETLAAAYAEERRFDDAVKTLTQAIEACRRNAGQDCDTRFASQLAAYQERRPFRQRIDPNAWYP
ncbi:MAG: tetratricopeptide repeat protein [Planctomycetes bacterium]|nr:tetratricopeptide repeat protein [Planctomycetota bacterium]